METSAWKKNLEPNILKIGSANSLMHSKIQKFLRNTKG